MGNRGLNRKIKQLLNKRLDSTPLKHCQFFRVGCLLTNFLHHQRMDFTMGIYGEEYYDEILGWDEDF